MELEGCLFSLPRSLRLPQQQACLEVLDDKVSFDLMADILHMSYGGLDPKLKRVSCNGITIAVVHPLGLHALMRVIACVICYVAGGRWTSSYLFMTIYVHFVGPRYSTYKIP